VTAKAFYKRRNFSLRAVGSGRPTGFDDKPSGITGSSGQSRRDRKVRVANRANGKSVIMRINDRDPIIRGGVIDVMPGTARQLGFSGFTRVTLVIVGQSERDGAAKVGRYGRSTYSISIF
jgi:hypothetical protein